MTTIHHSYLGVYLPTSSATLPGPCNHKLAKKQLKVPFVNKNASQLYPSPSMASVAALYNTLPSIEEANKAFVERDLIFRKVAPLLAEYNNMFDLCVVHRHCNLAEGEKMVSRGNISQPETDVEGLYPERWLATGEPYEFTVNKTVDPPKDLLERFREIVGAVETIDGVGILGLCFQEKVPIKADEMYLEHTEGRKNIVTVVSKDTPDTIPTQWHSDGGAISACQMCHQDPPGPHRGCGPNGPNVPSGFAGTGIMPVLSGTKGRCLPLEPQSI